MHSISLNTEGTNFKMADGGNIEAPESSSSTPATARNFKIAAYMIQNRCTFYDKHKRQLEDFQDIEEIFSDV